MLGYFFYFKINLGVAVDVHHLDALEPLPLQPETEVRRRRHLTAGHAVFSGTL